MKIGFIGLGIMGEPMCENVIKKHDDVVYVYDRVAEKISQLAQAGAIGCKSSLELAERSDIIITMVPKSEHSRAVYTEILPALTTNKCCIDMSTIDPEVSIEIAGMVKAAGADFLDAPVVKSRPAAEAGLLGIYVGGDPATYASLEPILHYMGKNVKYMGGNGRGLVMKICHNALVSQIQNGVNETAVLAGLNGIDLLDYAEAIGYGGGQNFYLDSKKEVLAREDFTTAFSVENMSKDVRICMKLAASCGFDMPGEANTMRVYARAEQEGLGKADFSATIKVVRGCDPILEHLNHRNHVPVLPVTAPEFASYGKVMTGYDLSGLTSYMTVNTRIPESGTIYVPSVPELESEPVYTEIQENLYGGMDIQIGYCNGRNTTYNGFEYHKGSEINIAVTGFMLVLGHTWDIRENTYHVGDAQVFYVPEGTAVELYQTTLHLAPCQISNDGFMDIIILQKGTNTPLIFDKCVRSPEDVLLLQTNKWVLAHPERKPLVNQGAHPGVLGENRELYY